MRHKLTPLIFALILIVSAVPSFGAVYQHDPINSDDPLLIARWTRSSDDEAAGKPYDLRFISHEFHEGTLTLGGKDYDVTKSYQEQSVTKAVYDESGQGDRFVSGDGSSWTRGSTEKLNFVVKRNRADETTVDHFKGLKVDGKEVPSSGYAAKAGSVVIDLMPAYLGTLADGDHTLTAVFDDGNKETSASFKVLSAADKGSKDKANSNKKGSPATGDEAQMLIWLMILCTAGLALSDRIIRRLKNRAADR